jgi:SMODS-associated and fused to various effectors sensor domain/TIR domain
MTAAKQAIFVFLSHAALDAKAGWIDPIEQGIRLRGIGVWRDVHRLLAGQHNWDAIFKAIDTCTAFVVVITPRSVKRPAVWKELRRADARWQTDHSFPIIPIVIGMTRKRLDDVCELHGIHPLSTQQAITVTRDRKAELADMEPDWVRQVAGEVLLGVVDRHLREIDRELLVAVRTYPEQVVAQPDLDMDWVHLFDPEPDPSTWARLLAALEDLASAVKNQTRQERFDAQLQARIGVGVALGWAIPSTSSRKVDVVHPDSRGTWRADAAAVDDGNTAYPEREDPNGDASVGTVLASIRRDTHAMYDRSPAIVAARYILEVNRLEEHPMSAETAAAAAQRIGRTIRTWCDTRDVTTVQIVGAMPIGLAVLIGRELNATTDVVVFHDRDRVYVEACRLPGGSKGAGGAGRGVTT